MNEKRGLIFMGLVLVTLSINGATLARIFSFSLGNWAVANGGGSANGGSWGTGDNNSNDGQISLPLIIDSRPKFTDGADTLTTA